MLTEPLTFTTTQYKKTGPVNDKNRESRGSCRAAGFRSAADKLVYDRGHAHGEHTQSRRAARRGRGRPAGPVIRQGGCGCRGLYGGSAASALPCGVSEAAPEAMAYANQQSSIVYPASR
jgi:hypothetical protein